MDCENKYTYLTTSFGGIPVCSAKSIVRMRSFGVCGGGTDARRFSAATTTTGKNVSRIP